MYRNSWPLLALATYRRLLERSQRKANGAVHGYNSSLVEVAALPS
jgi:hypothetical protein